jgi:hypothetical protein
MIQMIEKSIDLPPNVFFCLLEMMIEISEPHGETIDDNHLRVGWQPAERLRKFNGLLDRAKPIGPILAMPGDPLLHFLINGKSGSDENSP